MSSTTIKAVWPGEKVEDLRELRNSHGSAPVIWNEITKKYLGFKDHEYMFHIDDILPLYQRPDMPSHHKSVLLMVYDDAMVMQANYQQAASDIRAFLIDFPPREGYANHWPAIAAIFESNPECPAIGFHMTSVSEDPFAGSYNEDTEAYDAPDWSVYWDVYAEAAKWPAAST